MKISAYASNLVVTLIPEEERTDTGLFIYRAQDSHEKWVKATVESVGPQVKEDVSEGDTVVMDYWAGAAYKDVVIVPIESVLAVL